MVALGFFLGLWDGLGIANIKTIFRLHFGWFCSIWLQLCRDCCPISFKPQHVDQTPLGHPKVAHVPREPTYVRLRGTGHVMAAFVFALSICGRLKLENTEKCVCWSKKCLFWAFFGPFLTNVIERNFLYKTLTDKRTSPSHSGGPRSIQWTGNFSYRFVVKKIV